MKTLKALSLTAATAVLFSMTSLVFAEGKAKELEVKITPDMASVEVMHDGKKVMIKRDQNAEHKIPDTYNKTSRACPPFCIQPATVAPGVDTIAELEVLDYLKKAAAGDKSILVIDSRTSDWMGRGTIPGSTNIPWTKINVDNMQAWDTDQETEEVDTLIVETFGAKKNGDALDFSTAKTLVLFCNGPWCPQSDSNIKTLLKKGYPAEKLKWYRGGMQAWVSLGLSVYPEQK